MKNKFKIFTIITLLILSFVMVACDMVEKSQLNSIDSLTLNNNENNHSSINVENNEFNTNIDNIETLKTAYFYQMQGDVLEKMLEEKNEDYEMEVGVYDSFDDMVEEYIRTYVIIKVDFYDVFLKKMRVNVSSGNIYDIDDEYMYIIACAHGMRDNNDDEIKSLYIRFVDDTTITIDGANVFLPTNGKDVALIRIPLTYFNEETLGLIKTINFRNTFDIEIDEFSNNDLYCFRYKNYKYNVSYVRNIDISKINSEIGFELIDNNIENGTSGGGIIDINGNYYTSMLNENHFTLSMLYYYQDLLIVAKK